MTHTYSPIFDTASYLPARRKQYFDHLEILRVRLMIYLHRHPLGNTAQTMDVIERAESLGEIKLLLDYVLARGSSRKPSHATTPQDNGPDSHPDARGHADAGLAQPAVRRPRRPANVGGDDTTLPPPAVQHRPDNWVDRRRQLR